ncbi:hypothetical protein HJFPF1_00113 [Paramyrothecium foliicola]|nr:hypothetical protein HJFPF1_00113 [Paramyrothecium foliicola]
MGFCVLVTQFVDDPITLQQLKSLNIKSGFNGFSHDLVSSKQSDDTNTTVTTDTDGIRANNETFSTMPLSADDILLIVKTGGTTMWMRLLVHLTTTFATERIPHDNTVIYSDIVETVGNFTTVDALANMTDAVKSNADFEIWHDLPKHKAYNYYAEFTAIEGDDWGGLKGGWIIDKYKFIPLMQHAGREWPRARWYVYTEDDAYLFLPNVLTYLSRFDWRKPHYLGSYAGKSDVIFAHGGAGFALSRGAWEKSFGRNPTIVEEYDSYTSQHCCGDQVLAHALRRYGVHFGENGGDGKFTWGFNSVVHWAFGFQQYNWCKPLLSWHKVHNRDVTRYYELEKKWNFSKPLLYRDFFLEMILPHIQERQEWWDNMSDRYEVTSGTRDSVHGPSDTYDSAAWKISWESADGCEAACKSWQSCMQWSFVEDLCRMDDRIIMGQGFSPSMAQRKTSLKHTSGWLADRLSAWDCEE